MGKFFQRVLILVLISYVLSETPMYSVNYAKIRYEPRENWNSHKAELNLDERHKEEVTEKLPANDNSAQASTEPYYITTESESEQINLAKFVYRNIVKDKLVEGNENESTNRFEAENTTVAYEERMGTNNDGVIENKNIFREMKGSKKENLEDIEFLDNIDRSEVGSLNTQGVYYIYHPHMLLQKVVYTTQDDPTNMEFSTEISYKNIEPIVEPIYTYDPRTFVLQRLILRPQEQT